MFMIKTEENRENLTWKALQSPILTKVTWMRVMLPQITIHPIEETMKDTLVWKRSASAKTAKSTEWQHQLRVWCDLAVKFILKRLTCRKRKMLSLCLSCMQQRQVWPQITSSLRIWAMSKQEWGLILLCWIISPDILKLLTFIQHREFWTRVPLTEANSEPKQTTLSFTTSVQHSIPKSRSFSCRLSIPVH